MKYLSVLLLALSSHLFAATINQSYVLQSKTDIAPRFVQWTNASGQPYHWKPDVPITISFDTQTPQYAIDAVMNSFQMWNEQVGNSLTFEQRAVGGMVQVFWDTTGQHFTSVNTNPNNAIATTNLSSLDGIHISAITISFNVLHFDFHSGEPYGSTSPADSNSKGTADIEGTALHECGHALGLAHSTVIVNNDFPTMYPVEGPQTHFLHADDIAGIKATYGPAQQEASNPVSEQDRMVALFTDIGVTYTIQLNKKVLNPHALVGKTLNLITTGKTLYYFDSTGKFVGSVAGNKFSPKKD